MSGQPCRVGKFLGGGGQGEVYSAEWVGDNRFALKWYFAHMATIDQRDTLEKLVKESPPSNAFLWPLDIIEAAGVPDFGYIMRLREPRFKGLLDLVTRRVDPKYRAMVTMGLGLANNFYKLHAKGLCYRDISFGNAFFDKDTGEVLICDNDNVTENRSPRISVLGTPDFMAPEIVREEALPSRQTDLYSLAVLLFYVFHIQHPLVGKKILSIHSWDLPARKKLLGNEPVFIFDPKDKSNEAVSRDQDELGEAGANALECWHIYPQFLRDTFTQAFTKGLHDPENGRVTEGEWCRVLSQLRDSIFYCSACGGENFYDLETVKALGTRSNLCWQCKKELRLPFRIRIGKSIVMLTHDARLFSHHVEGTGEFDAPRLAAEVMAHPSDRGIWGLKNCTSEKWVATMPDGEVKDVEPGRSLRLADRVKVNFGKVEGEIRY
jgi:DNA-binding helix-hairpin-helix protein with protein kinase domain